VTLAPWNAEAWARLHERRRHGALPHALLLAGPAGLGKRAFADAFASALLCQSPHADGGACGACRTCQLFAVGTHPDLIRVNLELRDDGKPRTEITVDQMRALSERLVLTSQFGGMQIALIDPADAMNISASNALLKTLEEPTPGTLLVLIADHRARLMPTIRSRCQQIEFHLPSNEVALRWLVAQGVDAGSAHAVLAASDGNPARALDWLRSGVLKLRDEVARDLRDLYAGAASAYEVAQRWSKDDVDLRLHFAASLVREAARTQARGRAGEAALALTEGAEMAKLAAWFDRANRTRELLRGPLRPELALLELLAAWTSQTAA
jgi:DNA polymerase-3 subunit delta'